MTATANPMPGSEAVHGSDGAAPDRLPVLTQKSTDAACGMPVSSATVHAADAANPVSPADTHVTGSAFGATHTAHRVCAVPSFRLIAACCHRFPALSVTLTAGSGMTPPGVSVFQPRKQARNEPSCVVIGVVPIPAGASADPGAVCRTVTGETGSGGGTRSAGTAGVAAPGRAYPGTHGKPVTDGAASTEPGTAVTVTRAVTPVTVTPPPPPVTVPGTAVTVIRAVAPVTVTEPGAPGTPGVAAPGSAAPGTNANTPAAGACTSATHTPA